MMKSENGRPRRPDCGSHESRKTAMDSDSNCGVVPASCPSDQGPDQLRKNGKPDLVTECIEAAVASLPGRPGLNALTTGTHSEVVSTALAPATEAIEQQVTIDVNPES